MNEKELAEQIGRRFRDFRNNQGLRQEDISAVLGTSHTNISRLERGAVLRPSALFLSNCRAKLGLSVDWLVTGQGAMVLPEAEFKMGPPKLPRQKGRKKRSGRGYTLAEQRRLQRKLNQLTASLTKATRLAQELFAYTADRDAQAKRK